MIFPTIQDLSQDKFNRYEIALAAAKCARLVTNEYVHQRNEAEAAQTGNKETDKPLNAMIDKELRDEKAVKIAVARLYNHEYAITEMSPEEQEKAERAVLEGPEDENAEDENAEDEAAVSEDGDVDDEGIVDDGEPADEDADEDVVDDDAEDAADEAAADENAEEADGADAPADAE